MPFGPLERYCNCHNTEAVNCTRYSPYTGNGSEATVERLERRSGGKIQDIRHHGAKQGMPRDPY